MKKAIRYADLIALAQKQRRGEWVIWENLESDAESLFTGFAGVGRINYTQKRRNAPTDEKNSQKRYCKTKDEAAKLLGVSRKTLYQWERGGIVTLDRKQPPAYLRLPIRWGYDIQAIRKQLKDYERKNT